MSLENIQPGLLESPIARELLDSTLIEQYLAQLAEIAAHMNRRLETCERRLVSLQEQLLQRNSMSARFVLHAHEQQYQLQLQARNRAPAETSNTPQNNGDIFWERAVKNTALT